MGLRSGEARVRGAGPCESLSESLLADLSVRANDVEAANKVDVHAGALSHSPARRSESARAGESLRSTSPRTPSPKFYPSALWAAGIEDHDAREPAQNEVRREQQQKCIREMNEVCVRTAQLEIAIAKSEHWAHVMTKKTRPGNMGILHQSESWRSNHRLLEDQRNEMRELQCRHNELDAGLKQLARALSPVAGTRGGSFARGQMHVVR